MLQPRTGCSILKTEHRKLRSKNDEEIIYSNASGKECAETWWTQKYTVSQVASVSENIIYVQLGQMNST